MSNMLKRKQYTVICGEHKISITYKDNSTGGRGFKSYMQKVPTQRYKVKIGYTYITSTPALGRILK